MLAFQHFAHCLTALYRSWNVVNVLRLDDGFQVVFENLCKVVLQLATTEVLENILPIGRVLWLKALY